MAKVVIGVDPHKRMNAVVVLNAKGNVLDRKQFANTTAGFRELRAFSRQWRPRTWGHRGMQRGGQAPGPAPVAEHEVVVDVSTRRSALVRVYAGGNGRKTDDTDAHSIAMVGLQTPDLPLVRPDDRTVTLRLLSNRRHELVAERTRTVCRLHRDLVNLIPGGAPRDLTAKKAKEALSRIRPRDEVGRLRRRLAADQLGELVAVDKRLVEVERQIKEVVAATPTGLVRIFGVGPITTARILGEVGDVARFRSRHHFASYNGTAPADAGSGGVPVHRVNLKGNRTINHAIHMVAITQVRNDTPGRAYYLRKQAQSKTQKEALRALKRKISDAGYRQLVEDAGIQMGPGGQVGTTVQSSVTGPTPTTGSSDRPQPGPTPKATPIAASARQRGAVRSLSAAA